MPKERNDNNRGLKTLKQATLHSMGKQWEKSGNRKCFSNLYFSSSFFFFSLARFSFGACSIRANHVFNIHPRQRSKNSDRWSFSLHLALLIEFVRRWGWEQEGPWSSFSEKDWYVDTARTKPFITIVHVRDQTRSFRLREYSRLSFAKGDTRVAKWPRGSFNVTLNARLLLFSF